MQFSFVPISLNSFTHNSASLITLLEISGTVCECVIMCHVRGGLVKALNQKPDRGVAPVGTVHIDGM